VTLSSDNPYAPLEAERQIDQRIDYVLVRPGGADRAVTATEAFTVHGAIDGVHPSDHAPVVVDLQLRPPPSHIALLAEESP
jgi:exonuclease III